MVASQEKFPCETGILGNDCHNNRSFLVFNVLLGAWNPRNPDHSDFPKRKHPLRVFVSTDQNQQWNNNNNNNNNSDNDRDHDNDNDNDNDYDNDNDNDNVNDSDSDNDNDNGNDNDNNNDDNNDKMRKYNAHCQWHLSIQ